MEQVDVGNSPSQDRIGGRQFYLLNSKVHRRPPGLELLNGKDLFRDGYVDFAPPGLFERGFRTYPVRPRFRISTRMGRRLSDIEFYGAYWLVSDRARDALLKLSASDFSFLPTDLDLDSDEEAKSIWLCDVMPMLDAVDEARSRVKIIQRDDGNRAYALIANGSLVFDEAVVGAHHAFRMTTNFATVVCDDAFKARIKDVGLTGLSFQSASAF